LIFQNKRLLVGITGGIAAYKTASLVRRLVHDEGARVQVIMTKNAQEFVTPLTFATLTGQPVITEMFSNDSIGTRHIDLVQEADAVLVCPATANILAKSAQGIADDMLSTVILVAGNKTCFVPAMNTAMYLNPITQANLSRLKALGYAILEPDEGPLACQASGKGRMPDERVILAFLDQRLNGQGLLKGKKVVITAGPTRAPIDDIRFITNRSSGKMGYALAECAVREGAEVILITGPTALPKPWGVQLIAIETVAELQQALNEAGENADYLFMAAAVEDLLPVRKAAGKIKKEHGLTNIEIQIAPDLVRDFRQRHPSTCIIGFSVEIEDGLERSRLKMQHKGLNYVVWNNPQQAGAAFEHDTNAVTLIANDGRSWEFPLASKRIIADQIIRTVLSTKA